MNDLVAIERKDNVTLYGKIVGGGGKLGQFEVYSSHSGTRGPFIFYGEAKMAMNAMIGVKSSKLMTNGGKNNN